MGYVYRQVDTEWEVGFFSPFGWVTESSHKSRVDAVLRLRWLNGGEMPRD